MTVNLLPAPFVSPNVYGNKQNKGVSLAYVLPWRYKSKLRFRNFDEPNVTNSGTFYDRSTGVLTKTDPWIYDSFRKHGWMLDYVTNGWQTAISSGVIINNNMYLMDSIETQGGGNVGSQKTSDPTNFYWLMQNAPSTQFWWRDTRPALVKNISGELVAQKAPIGEGRIVKLNALAKVDQTPYSFSEDIGEIRQTLGFLSGNFRQIHRLLVKRDKLIKFYLSNGFSTAKAAANAWLQIRYALRPLIISANNLALALDDKTTTRPKRQIVRSSHYDEGHLTSRCRHTWTGSPAWRDFDQELRYDWRISAGLIYEIANPLYDFQYKFGLRGKDIPATVYNLLPYTFVLDWFINFNRSIKALVNIVDPNVRFITGWLTYKENNSLNTKLVDWYLSPGWVKTTNASDDWKVITKQLFREVWIPEPLDAIPIPELRLDINNLVDIASLLLQRLPVR